MTAPTIAAPAADQVQVPAWAWALTLFAAGFLYLLLQDNGALLAQYAHTVHEFTHDGRHALGVPCH
ncbi:MAG TPA: CbtB-domain containing protein [Catenuloplanes sp.]|jgi:hypothetical protein